MKQATTFDMKAFKNEYRLVCSDTWGDAMDAWFEAAGHMNKRGLNIPSSWEYRPGLGSTAKRIPYQSTSVFL